MYVYFNFFLYYPRSDGKIRPTNLLYCTTQDFHRKAKADYSMQVRVGEEATEKNSLKNYLFSKKSKVVENTRTKVVVSKVGYAIFCS